MSFELERFGYLFLEPQRNGLTRPKRVRGVGFPMVNMGELFAHSRIKDLEMDLVPVNEEKEQQFFLKDGDLLFARQSLVLAGAGQCSIFIGNKIPTVFESHLIRCRLDQKRFNPHFYFYFFRSPDGRRAIEAIVEQGAGASGIRGSDLVNVQVPTPSKSYQDEAAGLLVEIDDRITLLRETNTALEAIAQTLFKSWFVDFYPVRAKAEGLEPEGMDAATAALFPDSFEDSELGLVPMGWKAGCVADIAVQKKGSVNPLASPNEWFEHYSLPAFDSGQSPVLELGKSIKSNKTPLPEEAVLLSKLNPHIPRVWLPVKHGGNAVCSTEFLAYSPKAGGSKELIYCLFSSAEFQQQLCQLVTGTSNSHQRVKPDQVLKLRLAIADDSLLIAFADIASPIFERVYANRLKAQTLTQLRDTLLPRLISGQLRLPETEVSIKNMLSEAI